MPFSLLHNLCGTATLTISKETRSVKWIVAACLTPLALAFLVCGWVALMWRLAG
jgi:ferrous iron transport protein B